MNCLADSSTGGASCHRPGHGQNTIGWGTWVFLGEQRLDSMEVMTAEKARGKFGPLKVLFVCVGNCCRSQMAEGLARKLAPEWEVYSAGLLPAGYISDKTIAVMLDKEVDISEQRSKGLDDVDVDSMHVIVALGGFPSSYFVSRPEGKVIRQWDIADPIGHNMKFYRFVCDEIEEKVSQLATELNGAKKGV